MANSPGFSLAFKSGPHLLRSALWVGILTLVLGTMAVVWLNSQVHKIQLETQEDMALLLARGLANALTPAMITRDYADLEARLVQTMADEQVVSAMVVDLEGKVLSRVERRPDTGELEVIFEGTAPRLPASGSEQLQENLGGYLVLWQRIEPGVSLGWLRLETRPSRLVTLLESTLRQVTLIAVALASTLLIVLSVVFLQTHYLFRTRENDLLEGQRLLQTAATHDSVTGLPNRRFLMAQLGQAVAENRLQAHGLALCYLDLDGFKQINDTMGHEAGDYVLIEIAHRLRGCVRQGDTVARLGGDEFVLLLTGVENQFSCEEILQRVVQAVKQPLWYQNCPLEVTVSMGVARFPSDGFSADVLLNRADQAMYRAKRAGKNCWRWYQIPTQA